MRTIFRRYLDLGSTGPLIEDLDRRGIRTEAVARLNGRVRGGIHFGVGALAHVLKNRFHLGEVVYRGEVHVGEHEQILDRDLFEAVQAKLAANAVARKVKLRGSASILAGRIYDDRGNRMSPTHSNKLGVRYRYYVSHALLQNRTEEAGSVKRVPAPEIEQLVLDGVRTHLLSMELPAAAAERDLIEHHVDRVIIKLQAVEVHMTSNGSTERAQPGTDEPALPPTPLMLPWAAPSFLAVKGIAHEPAAKPVMKPESRDALLAAIARARGWIEDLRLGRAASLAQIAERECLGERHVRLLAPLAFVAPRVLAAITDGNAPADLTITGLAKALSCSWAEQQRGFPESTTRP